VTGSPGQPQNLPLRLILFDVDGTLVDSQASIVEAMITAFAAARLPVPDRTRILSIVGLSLDHGMRQLAPDAPSHDALVESYKQAYHAKSLKDGSDKGSPLYPGARATLERLAAVPENILGVATGKSQRGLEALLEAHGLQTMFATCQVADHHPSKPHPSMIETAMAETGVDRDATVMIGDTSFDMEMAQSAGVASIGVNWGYHDRQALRSANTTINSFAELDTALNRLWNTTK
jgi:phosphoglycolate phosphatase